MALLISKMDLLVLLIALLTSMAKLVVIYVLIVGVAVLLALEIHKPPVIPAKMMALITIFLFMEQTFVT